MDAGCDEDLLVVATASVGFLVMAILSNLASGQAVLKSDINNAFISLHCDIKLSCQSNMAVLVC